MARTWVTVAVEAPSPELMVTADGTTSDTPSAVIRVPAGIWRDGLDSLSSTVPRALLPCSRVTP